MDVREKLVELLTGFYGCDPMYYNVDALAIADHLISNGVIVQKWIPVNDRLPTEDDADEIGRVWAKLRGEHPKAWHWTLVHDYPEDFTRWMPLPQPPKGE